MDTKQFLEYEWEYGNVEIALHVGKYLYGGLYIEMLCREDGNWETFSDLTKNIPGYVLEENEAYITHDFSDSKLKFIKKHKLGTVMPDYARSGFCTYHKVAFDLKRLAELDPDGVKQFAQEMDIEIK